MKNRVGTLLGAASLGAFLIFMGYTAAAWIRNGIPGEMSNVEFAAEVIKAIAWPAVPVLFFVLFRERIDLLLEHVTFESPGGWKFTAKVAKGIDQAIEKLVEGEQEREKGQDTLTVEKNEEPGLNEPERAPESTSAVEKEDRSSSPSAPEGIYKSPLDSIIGQHHLRRLKNNFEAGPNLSEGLSRWESKQSLIMNALYTWERTIELATLTAIQIVTTRNNTLEKWANFSPRQAFSTLLTSGYINASEFESLTITLTTRNEIAHARQSSLPASVIEKFDALTKAMFDMMKRVSQEADAELKKGRES
ncbi:hypothetical protein [Herbaspirillum huttiense]|uniref:Uncharacterized protein n=2 Tax=Herbaspirillum huttiense TaxID=863372 RepID=A0AAJ2H5U8_9BURK|nr:hypothetical protein [Herbaspirillum huttiense]MDR9834884.1 hypothetical protein [Herbaspirillum huttiense]